MMTRQEALQLFEKYNQGMATEEEEILLEQWYHREQSGQRLSEQEADFFNLKDRIWSGTLGRAGIVQRPTVIKVQLWPRITIVAAAIATLVFGVYFFKFYDSRSVDVFAIVDGNISPGKAGATLTLANGKKLRLSDFANGELAKEAGAVISKTAGGQLVYETRSVLSAGAEENTVNTLSTAKGETYVLTLPDQTKVWLNAASSITYNTRPMEHGIRSVKLTGEAYFEVVKDKLHPFIVDTKGQQIEVLGTHFNIRSYTEDSSVKTTLLEGRVKVSVISPAGTASSGADRNLILQPGQQSVLNGARLLKAENVNIEDVMAWKLGKFSFDNKSFKEVMNELGRWYNLEVIYQDDIPAMGNFFGRADRSSSLALVLRLLESAGVKYRVTADRKLIISYQTGQ